MSAAPVVTREITPLESRSHAIRLLCEARGNALFALLYGIDPALPLRAAWQVPYDAADYSFKTCTGAIAHLARQ